MLLFAFIFTFSSDLVSEPQKQKFCLRISPKDRSYVRSNLDYLKNRPGYHKLVIVKSLVTKVRRFRQPRALLCRTRRRWTSSPAPPWSWSRARWPRVERECQIRREFVPFGEIVWTKVLPIKEQIPILDIHGTGTKTSQVPCWSNSRGRVK